jgi:hypothetical protein
MKYHVVKASVATHGTIAVVHHELYGAAAAAVLALHLLWLLFVAFGALFTARRRLLTALHVVALTWGIAVEAGPWPCPLTTVEQRLLETAGEQAYTRSFLAHYLDRLVYPDIPERVLVGGAIAVCVLNLCVYAYRFIAAKRRRSPGAARYTLDGSGWT